MLARTLEQQMIKYLTDAHSIEEQALVQMRAAPGLTGDAALAHAFQRHLGETEEHERLIRERLRALGAEPSSVKDVVMKAGGGGFALFARSQPDTTGKLAAHAYSYEHLELAAYELLARVAERAGDIPSLSVIQRIRDEEQAMADRLAQLFDASVAASLDELSGDDVRGQLVSYLADAHAIEEQSRTLLRRSQEIAGESELRGVCERHLEQTEAQAARIEQLLRAHGASPSKLKDAAMRLGALNWSLFFQAQPDTPGKLVAFLFAFEHLEIAGYEQLARVAEAAGAQETAGAARDLVDEERAAAASLRGCFDAAVSASLDAQAVMRSFADAAR